MTIIQLFVFTTIAVGLQHLLYKIQILTHSWYHAIRHTGEGWNYWRAFVILWIALILSEEIVYIIGRKLYA
jgi:hypothetical protein